MSVRSIVKIPVRRQSKTRQQEANSTKEELSLHSENGISPPLEDKEDGRTLPNAEQDHYCNDRMSIRHSIHKKKTPNAGLQLRRAISIQAEGIRLLEKHAIAPSAARLCCAARSLNHSI